MRLLFFVLAYFFFYSGNAWSLVSEYNCISSKINSYNKSNIRFQINNLDDNGSNFSLVSIRKTIEISNYEKWGDWSFIEFENKNKSKLVWFSYKDSKNNEMILKVPHLRYRFDISTSELILERAYQPLGILSAHLGNYSCRIVGKAF